MDLIEVVRPAAVEACCRRARTYLSVARAVAHRILLSARAEDHPLQRDDLLRSMLVFACAGMDRSCKALVQDAFPGKFVSYRDRRGQKLACLSSFTST
jgi:hypothetical protein